MAHKVVVFGGNGFVGSEILKKLAADGIACVGVSRRHSSLPGVTWHAADALDPSTFQGVLQDASAVVISIGSPPLPFVDYDYQFKFNGTTNTTVLDAAERCGVKKAVVVGATMPTWAPKGYFDGKVAAERRALEFAKDGREAVVLKPSPIYGTRRDGPFPVPLAPVLAPVSWLLRATRPINRAVIRVAPSLFDGVLVPPVPVAAVAAAAVDNAVKSKLDEPFAVIDVEGILNYA